MKDWLKVNQYGVLKTFYKGETIKYEVDNVPRISTFVRVSYNYLTILNSDNKEEYIELNRITRITL